MSYTCSMDASLRVKKTGVSGYLHHLFRDLYEDYEKYNYSNKNIDTARTSENLSLVYDDDTGELVRPSSPEEMKEKLLRDVKAYSEQYTANTGKAVRADAVYLRPLMFQLGSGFYDDFPEGVELEDGDKHGECDYILEWARLTWGEENIRGVSVHMDETHPHMVLLVSAVRENADGKLTMNQKSIINGDKHLTSLHKSFRSFMKDKGLDVRLENLETSHPHYDDDKYKEIMERERGLDEREQKVAEQEELVRKGKKYVKNELKKLEEGKSALEQEKADFEQEKQTYNQEINAALAEVALMHEQAEELLQDIKDDVRRQEKAKAMRRQKDTMERVRQADFLDDGREDARQFGGE